MNRLNHYLYSLISIAIIFWGYTLPLQVYAHPNPPLSKIPVHFPSITSLPTTNIGRLSDALYLHHNKVTGFWGGSVTVNAGPDQNLLAGATVASLSGTLSGAATGNSNVANLIVIFGESNASGEAPNSSCTSTELAIRSTTKIWNDNSNAFESMQIGTNNQIQQGYNPVNVHGFENGLANEIVAGHLAQPTYLVKLGSPGARIDQWLNGGNAQNGQMGWSVLVARMNAAINNLNAQGIAFKITVWESIGINDFNAGTSNSTYQSRMEQFRSDFRNLYGGSIPFLTTLFFASHPYDPVIQAISDNDPQKTSMAIFTDDAPRQADGAHWTHDGYMVIAGRMVSSMTSSGSTVSTSTNWTKLSGPAGGNISSPGSLITGITSLQAGTYVFRLTAIQNSVDVATSQVTVIVAAAAVNKPLIANAGADINITLPTNSITIDGSLSTDPNGSISSWLWTKISGPTQLSIVNNTASSSTVNNLTTGIYLFQLKVTDNSGAMAMDTLQVTVNPAASSQPPVANAGADKSITLPINTVVIDGSASTAPSGNIVSYVWSEKTGPSAVSLSNTTQNSLSNLQAGIYVFSLTVTDNKGASSSASVSITVIPHINRPPVANAGPDVNLVLPNNSTNLDGSKSSDPDGTISSYLWTRISGPNMPATTGVNAAVIKLEGLVPGTYTYQLTVTDNSGASNSAQVNIIVAGAPSAPTPPAPPTQPLPNTPPTANAGSSQTITAPANSVALNGSASSDPDGKIISYNWVTVSGPGSATINNSNTVNPGVIGLQPGIYIFELTVTDNNGLKNMDRVTVTVNPASNTVNSPPVANAGSNDTLQLPNNSYTLNAGKSSDADGHIVSYQWQQIRGPNKVKSSNMGVPQVAISDFLAGEYEFQVVVTNNAGLTSTAFMKLTVEPGTGIHERLLIYPNPAHDLTTARITSSVNGTVKIVIYDMNGRLVLTTEAEKTDDVITKTININTLASGMYSVQVVIGNKKTMITKFVKN